MMRGAGLRLSIDVRRHWQCLGCGAERRLPATVTTVRCQCTGAPLMRLVESQRRDRGGAEPPNPVLEFDLTDEPVNIPDNLPVPDYSNRPGRGPRGRRPPTFEPAPPPPPEATTPNAGPPTGPEDRGRQRPPRSRERRPRAEGPNVTPPSPPPATSEEDFGAGLDSTS